MRLTFHKKNPSEKIKEATLELLSTESYDSISMRKIAREAGVALGQLTYYYKTKDSLMVSVIRESLEVFYNEFEKFVKNSKNKVESIVDVISKTLSDDQELVSLLSIIITQSKFNKRLKKVFNEFWVNIVNLISLCYEEEYEISKEDSNLKARLFLGSCFESMIEIMLGIKYEVNNEMELVKVSAKKLGEING